MPRQINSVPDAGTEDNVDPPDPTSTGPDGQVVVRKTRRGWSEQAVRDLGVTTDLLTAADVLTISRSKAYDLAKAGNFPVPLIKVGDRYVVPVRGLLDVLRIADETPEPAPPAADPLGDAVRQIVAAIADAIGRGATDGAR